LPPREDLMRIARYFGSPRRPARAELLMYGFAGVLIGAGVALLFAPARGSELRSRIGNRVDEYVRTASGYAAPNGADRGAGA
jgi:YtxH-like protein